MKKIMSKINWEAPASALAKWNPEIKAAKTEGEVLNIYSTIGEYGDGSGVTEKIVSSVLRKANGADLTVNMNSPGGDFFAGITIYNMLKEYEGNVTVKVLGLAASAASIVALAADKVEVAESGFFMIHNAWTLAIGNKNDMQEVAAMLSKFDDTMMSIYAEKTGMNEKQVKKIMDAETWLSGKEAVDFGFADAVIGNDALQIDQEDDKYNAALRKLDISLAQGGMPRSERRALIKEITSTPCAASDKDVMPRADEKLNAALSGLLNTIKL